MLRTVHRPRHLFTEIKYKLTFSEICKRIPATKENVCVCVCVCACVCVLIEGSAVSKGLHVRLSFSQQTYRTNDLFAVR